MSIANQFQPWKSKGASMALWGELSTPNCRRYPSGHVMRSLNAWRIKYAIEVANRAIDKMVYAK